MERLFWAWLGCFATVAVRIAHAEDAIETTPATPPVRLSQEFKCLPLNFETNLGQSETQVKFLARGNGYGIFLTSTAMILVLRAEQSDRAGPAWEHAPGVVATPSNSSTTLRMSLIGANPRSAIVPVEELAGKVNYFVGASPKQWRTNISTYAKVLKRDVYPGIDLLYYGNEKQLEYDFIVGPGANPKEIALRFDGTDEIEIDADGNLVLHTRGGRLIQHAPIIYQVVGGQRRHVAGRYVLCPEQAVESRDSSPNEEPSYDISRLKHHEAIRNPKPESQNPAIRFEVGHYDHTRALIIDPVLSYTYFLGGNKPEYASGIAVDSNGNTYIAGYTFSANFPTVNPLQPNRGAEADNDPDVFVAKLNPGGTALIYATYLGGSSGQLATGLAIDPSGSAYVCGISSTNFPVVNALQPMPGGGLDTFVAKLNPAGSALVYSTFLGGSGLELSAGIAVDGAGQAYITGTTSSPDFPVVNALQPVLQEGACTNGPCSDAFVAKINPAGSALVYATYLGGTGVELGSGIAVDASGNAFVTGTTGSTNFPTRNAFQAAKRGTTDVFVTKLDPTGSTLVYSTYLGGSLVQLGSGIAVDLAGSAYITGLTLSHDFPTLNALQPTFGGGDCDTGTQTGPCPDAFVTKLNPSGSALVYSTYLGGSSAENIQAIGSSLTPFYGIAVDAAGNAYVTGSTSSSNFPTTNAVQRGFGGGDCGALPCPDAYLAKLNPAGSAFIYSTFLGGDGAETTSAVAVDSAGNAYVVGESRSTTFRKASVSPEIVTERNDAFVVRIADSSGTIPPAGAKVFRSFGFNAVGNLEFELSVDPATVYSLDVSTDLRAWVPLVVFQEKDGRFRFVDFAAFDFFQRFYRVTPVPQP